MKTIKTASIISIFMLSFVACITENPEPIQTQIDKNKAIEKEISSIDNLLDDIKPSLQAWSANLKEFEFITFEVVKNLNTDEISLANFKAVEIFPITSADAYYKLQRASYIVSCDNEGDDNDWEEECSGVYSCGALVKRCFEEGGCAQICENKSRGEVQYASVELMFLPAKHN